MSRYRIGIAIIGIGLAVLLLKPENTKLLGLNSDQLASALYLLPLTAVLGAGILASRRRWSQSVRQLMIWMLIILALATISLFREDAERTGLRLLAGLLPGHAVTTTDSKGRKEVLLSRSLNGHFSAVVTVNAQDIPMLIDTGASTVTLTYEDAVQVGIIPENLTYSTRVLTANGEALAAPIDLTMMQLGPIKRENVPALVTRKGAMDESLLGMSFLTTLSSFQMQSDELRLKD